jgi:hypothetical protein
MLGNQERNPLILSSQLPNRVPMDIQPNEAKGVTIQANAIATNQSSMEGSVTFRTIASSIWNHGINCTKITAAMFLKADNNIFFLWSLTEVDIDQRWTRTDQIERSTRSMKEENTNIHFGDRCGEAVGDSKAGERAQKLTSQ